MPGRKTPKKPPEVAALHLDEMLRLAAIAKNPVVLIYGNPDPDALASALALKTILDAPERDFTIAYTGAVGRPENASMIRYLKIPAAPLTKEQLDGADLIALVDSQPQFFKGMELPRCDIVIDHHPMLLDREVPVADISPAYLSASSIMTEYIRASGRRLTKRLASALYYGIKVDSRHFFDLSPGDVEAIKWLRGTADRDIVKRIEFSQFSEEALDYFNIALVRRRYEKGVIFSHLGPVPFMDVCVQVADFLIRVEKVAWALVTGVVGDSLVIVFRNDGMKKDAGTLARKAFGDVGSAGGHKSMGRAEIKQPGLPEGLLLTDDRGVVNYVLGSLAKINKSFGPILRSFKKSCGKPCR